MQTIGGETALMKAAENGNLENCISLLRNGCDAFSKDSQGRTADIFA